MCGSHRRVHHVEGSHKSHATLPPQREVELGIYKPHSCLVTYLRNDYEEGVACDVRDHCELRMSRLYISVSITMVMHPWLMSYVGLSVAVTSVFVLGTNPFSLVKLSHLARLHIIHQTVLIA